MAPKPIKPAADWELIEKLYRAGILSLREIAKQADDAVTEGAIRKRSKRDKWVRSPKLTTERKQKVVLETKDEMSSAGFLYVIYIDNGVNRFYKIGMSKRFDARFETHQCASPFEICVALCYFTGNMRQEERALHAAYSDLRVRGEWFLLGATDLVAIAQRALLV